MICFAKALVQRWADPSASRPDTAVYFHVAQEYVDTNSPQTLIDCTLFLSFDAASALAFLDNAWFFATLSEYVHFPYFVNLIVTSTRVYMKRTHVRMNGHLRHHHDGCCRSQVLRVFLL